MHVKKMSKSDKLAVLFLAGIFTAGVTLGSIVTALVCRHESEEPEAPQPSSHVAEPVGPTEEAPLTGEQIEESQPTHLGEFKLTAYCTCEKCCGEWADGITYTGTQATAGRTVAVDPDVIPLGSKVYIDGAEYIAEDIGGAIQGNRIDVFYPTHQEALQFGIRYADVSILN